MACSQSKLSRIIYVSKANNFTNDDQWLYQLKSFHALIVLSGLSLNQKHQTFSGYLSQSLAVT